jgi:hypothetical protein
MASPFPFTSGQVLTAAQLNSIGEITAFTPSWNNFTPGNATESWNYTLINETLFVWGQTVLGSTSSVTGSVSMDIPVGTTNSANSTSVGTAYWYDQNSGVPAGVWTGFVVPIGTTLRLHTYSVSGSQVRWQELSATAPFTWTNLDVIRFSAMVPVS